VFIDKEPVTPTWLVHHVMQVLVTIRVSKEGDNIMTAKSGRPSLEIAGS
jgi:hypothetical protein